MIINDKVINRKVIVQERNKRVNSMEKTAVVVQINASKLTAELHVIETLYTLITIVSLFQSAFNVASYSSIHVSCHYIMLSLLQLDQRVGNREVKVDVTTKKIPPPKYIGNKMVNQDAFTMQIAELPHLEMREDNSITLEIDYLIF